MRSWKYQLLICWISGITSITFSPFFLNAVRILFAVKVIFVSWMLSDIVKIRIGERCKFWLLHEHLTAALDLQLFCWAAAKFGSSCGAMMDRRRAWRALALSGIPLTCCRFVRFGAWCCCLRCCSLGCGLDHMFLLWTCRCIQTTCRV